MWPGSAAAAARAQREAGDGMCEGRHSRAAPLAAKETVRG